MSSRTFPTRGIVLRTRIIGEKDRVLVLLTPERGKISAAARGARNPKSKLAAAAQAFTLGKFLIAKGRSLDIVSQAEIENAHTHIAGDLVKTAWASYFCELCDAVPEELPDAELFDILLVALSALDNAESGDTAENIGRWLEAKYLAHLGYAPILGRCVTCNEKIVVAEGDMQSSVAFSPALGGTLCRACSFRDAARIAARAQALRALRNLERADAPIETLEILSNLTSQARRDLRDVLQRSLGAHLEIKWRSRAFLDEVLNAA
jgi:DNA repair protein RecO (recombination protein O)